MEDAAMEDAGADCELADWAATEGMAADCICDAAAEDADPDAGSRAAGGGPDDADAARRAAWGGADDADAAGGC